MVWHIGMSIREERVKYRHTPLADPKYSHMCTEDKNIAQEKIEGETDLKTTEFLNFSTACKWIYQHIG